MTGKYPNGRIPNERLVIVGSGINDDGYWEHRMPPATHRKHSALVRLGIETSGRVLHITPGWNAYRPLAAQVQARNAACARGRCGDAAYPGTSSHGGCWSGEITRNELVDTAAIDYANWLDVFGSRDAFYSACREVGMVPNVFDWEPWHVIDLNPWAPVPVNTIQEEEMNLPLVITVSHPASNGNQVYWSVDLAARTKSRIKNGVELDWRRALGVPEYVNQSPAVLEGYIEIGA